MRRREFITLIGGAAAASPLAARAQQAGRTYRVVLVGENIDAVGGRGPVMGRAVPALLDELRRLGFSEGQNLTMDYRSTNKPVAQFALDLADMVRAKPDVIVSNGAEPQLQAVMPVSGLIPIVFWANNFDPIERGYVKSLSRHFKLPFDKVQHLLAPGDDAVANVWQTPARAAVYGLHRGSEENRAGFQLAIWRAGSAARAPFGETPALLGFRQHRSGCRVRAYWLPPNLF
jgi:hypothetical protein